MALIHHWPLNDNAASTTVVASTGTGATLVGGDNTSVLHSTDAPGGSITASLHFNGSDDAVDISAASISFANAAAWSVSLWFKLDGAFSAPLIADIGTALRSIVVTSDTQIRFTTTGGTSRNYAVPSLGTTWHHLLVTLAGGTTNMRLWVDGTESSTGTIAVGNSTFNPDHLAAHSGFYDGRLAWVKIFDTDEAANVATLYAEGSGGGGSILPLVNNIMLGGVI